MNGTDLLAEFKRTRAEAPFGEIVRRYTNLVYSIAKRRLGNGTLAEEVTQTVFIRLARAVPALRGDAELAAWLHRTTVHASIDLWRSEARRRAREDHAAAMQPDRTEPATWNEIAPVLDEALNELTDGERQVILLRFFEQKTMRDLGLAVGVSEDAAKMRVSRAMDRLRSVLGEKGATCGATALGALLIGHAVEAAPSGLVLALAAIEIPIAAGGAGAGMVAWLVQFSRSKLAAGTVAGLIAGVAALIWLRTGSSGDRTRSTDAPTASSREVSSSETTGSAASNRSAAVEQRAPDPLKLLEGVVRARSRIGSGEMEFTLASTELNSPVDGTNSLRLQARFDGSKRRFESFTREYAFTSMAPDAREVTRARMQAEGLDHERAVQAGLLKEFESHHVTIYDGSLLMDYWENDGKPVQARIEDPVKGLGQYVFDPRCLGITISPGVMDTIESCLRCDNAASAQLIGEEVVEGVSAWRVRLQRWTLDAEFWFDAANPIRVLKYVFNGSVVTSTYDERNPRDPIPMSVVEMFLHGTVGTETAFTERRILRRNARFNVPVDPVSWTLAGLEMRRGTDVIDYRISRAIGYWTGTGLSDNPPSGAGEPAAVPDRAELLSVLEFDPGSATGLAAAHWILLNTPDGPEVARASEVILQNHIVNTNLTPLCQELERLRHGCASKLLTAMLEKNPTLDVRGNACLALAMLRKEDSKYGEDKKATLEAEKLFQRVISEFAQVKRNGKALAELARPELSELQHLTIGQRAPVIEGQDLEGNRLRWGDYRDQAVLLVFWGECGGCRPDVPRLREMLERFKGKPFAILGVFCDQDVAKAKEIAEKSGMAWPSLRDGRSGPISKAWNNDAWPVFQVLDRRGVIRFRNVPEIQLAKRVETVLAE